MLSNTISLPETLEKILNGINLNELEASSLMSGWLKEELSPVQTGAFLAALRAKGVSGLELSAMANILREACSVPCDIPKIPMVDTCGTGGDGADTFNISTAVAFTAASCGVNVSKHGNRSASGKVGSADVLEGLGLQLNAPLQRVVEAITEANVTFLFAPLWHPALINLAPLRKNLGVRTVFNLLGPLVNPLRPQAQVLGVARPELLDPMAEALQGLGLSRAVVVHGAGGLDEASLEGPSEMRLLENGQLRSFFLDPAQLGLEWAPSSAIKGGDLNTNKKILIDVLQGKSTKAQQDVVALNTSLVLWAAGIKNDFVSGLDSASHSLAKGLPWERLEFLKRLLEIST